MYSIIKTVLVFLYFSVSLYAQKLSFSLEKEKQVDVIFREFNKDNTAGLSVAFVKKDSLFFKSYGMANLEYNSKIDSASVFNLASVSKQFTAFTILLLENEGKLKLTDNIKKYLPDFPDYGKTITIENLLNHTSGLRSCLQLLGLKGFTTDNVITPNDIRQVIYRQETLNFKPNDTFSYSNSGYFLLSEIVESITKQSFSQFLKTRVFKPLQMNSSFVMDDFHRIVKNRANSYEISNGSYVNAPANYSYTGTTGVYSTIFDMLKWADNFITHKVGHESVFNKMKTFSVLNSGRRLSYTAGQFFESYNGIDQFYHSGADAGYRTYLGRFPELNASIIILSNNNTIDVRQKALKVIDVFLASHFIKVETKQKTKKRFKMNTPVEKFQGNYISSKTYITRKIFVQNDTLWYARPEQNGRKTNLNPFSFNSFQLGVFQDVDVRFLNDSLNVYVDNNLVESYTKYLPKEYDKDELKQFLGNYYSRELDETYNVILKNDKLVITHPKIDDIELNPVFKDGFLSSSWQFRFLKFIRNKEEQIISFNIESERVNNINFLKI